MSSKPGGAKGRRRGGDGRDVVIENRRARYDYSIGETLEVGIQLHGSEVKAVREGQASLAEGYVRAEGDPPELTLHGVNIGEYAPAGAMQHHKTRARRLLAHRREIQKLAKASQAKGMTIVPLKLYFKHGFAKLLVGVASGKGKADKRHDIAKREQEREVRRAMSRRV